MYNTLGFFDVDCRELSPDGKELVYRPRVKPIEDKLEDLYRLAGENGIPVLFTTCCSGRMLEESSIENILYIPLSGNTNRWKENLENYRCFYLQKKAYGDSGMNYSCRAFDVFNDNCNIPELIERLGKTHWVLFGNGLDLCVYNAVKGILSTGCKVTLLTDILIPGAKGYGNCGTEENRRMIFEELSSWGVMLQSCKEFLASLYRVKDK